jgi:NDP-sugar pyrophosphorylase family protein
MAKILQELCPTGRIVGIPPHTLGPIHAVKQIEHLLDADQPVVINYCDFCCYWDWNHFKSIILELNCAGAIPAYKGFHPHSLGSTNYAYIKELNRNGSGWVGDIQEKQPFTDDRMQEYASSGTYYFASAGLMISCLNETIKQNLNINGEFYVSLAYKYLLSKNKKIAIYPLEHFMQWGTPEDLSEFNSWFYTFNRLLKHDPIDNSPSHGSLIIPMAGMGKRFYDEGYRITKPLIEVSGKPMAIQAIFDLPSSKYQSLIFRADMHDLKKIETILEEKLQNAKIVLIPQLNEGQACTALVGLNSIDLPNCDNNTPITFGACDNGVLFNHEKYQALVNDPNIDIIVWGARGHANAVRNPKMFGWIDANNDGKINSVSVKSPFSSPATDPIVIGTFTFKHMNHAKQVIESLINRSGKINGEFYLDSCINDAIENDLNCHLFEVDSYISWGTPNDLKTFEYWQSCFHKWPHHPYRLELDFRIDYASLENLTHRYTVNSLKLYKKDFLR